MIRNTRLWKTLMVGLVMTGLLLMLHPLAAQEATAEPTSQVEDYLNQAREYFDQGEYSQAIDTYTNAIELAPDSLEAYGNRGLAYARIGDYEQAMSDYNRAIELGDTFASYVNRGIVYAAQGDYENAIADFTTSIETVPYPESFWQRGKAYFETSDYEKAIEDFNSVLEFEALMPTGYSKDAFLYRGRAYRALGDFNQAIDDFNHAIELDPNNVELFIDRGLAYRAAGDPEQAIASYQQAIEIDANFPPAYYGLAETYLRQDDYEQAVENFTLAIEAPNGFAAFPPAYLARGYALANLGQTEAAAQDWWMWTTAQMEFAEQRMSLDANASFELAMEEGVAYRIAFMGKAGQTVNAQAKADEGADVDALLLILNAADEPLIGNDDSGDSGDSLIQGFVLPEEGWYTLVVTHAAGGSTGGLEVTLEVADAGSASGEVCMVATDQADFATVRVGPGQNRSTILFLPASESFPVIGQATADDGSLWWRLDKDAVAPSSSAAELWVAQDQVVATGSCAQVGEVDAPPVIPMASSSGEDSGEAGLVPASGAWTHVPSSGTLTCPNADSVTVDPPFASHQDILTVQQDGAVILLEGSTFSRTGPGAYEARIPGEGGILVFTLRVVSSERIDAPMVIAFDNGCTASFPTTFTRAS